MSRHRNVRGMNYDEDYAGYDDVYGHSVEDDFCVPSSPSAQQYMYDRDKKPQLSTFFPPEEKISEEPEGDDQMDTTNAVDATRKKIDSLTLESASARLSPEDEVLLKSCLDEIRSVVGDTIRDSVIISHILRCNFDFEKSLHACLESPAVNDIAQSSVAQAQPKQRREPERPLEPLIKGNRGAVSSPTVKRSSEPAKVITAARSSQATTLGFDLPRSSTPLISTPSNSKAPSPTPFSVPSDEPSVKGTSKPAKEFKGDAAVKEYSKERGSGKDLLNLLVIGHVDAGKSTLMGHLLFQLGQVNQRSMHKFEQESKKIGKQSFLYAWVLDETGEERSRGITMDVGHSKFETDSKSIVLLDAPGHKDFIPNMITGASQADVAVLVVDSTTGEFETGFESGGQTREHALLVRSLGVNQLIVAVNKLDTVNWSKDRFDDIQRKLTSFLVKHAGYRENDLTYVPCSGLIGENLTMRSNNCSLSEWYNGQTLLSAIDSLKPPERPVGKPLRITVNDVFKGPGGLCVGGRVETGMVQASDKVLMQPIGEIATVKSISIDNESGSSTAFAGDSVLLTLLGLSDSNVISIGCVLSDPNYPSAIGTRFQARIVTFDAMSVPFTKGFTGVMHLGAMSEQVSVRKMISQLNKGTGEVIKAKPRCLGKNTNGIVELETSRPICVEEFKDVKELGRFTLRSSGVTIAAGLVIKVL